MLAMLMISGGIGAGAFLAHLYMASQGEVLVETKRLAVTYRPDINPILYMITSATLTANAAALLLAAVREYLSQRQMEPPSPQSSP
jgi:hypothetical protein